MKADSSPLKGILLSADMCFFYLFFLDSYRLITLFCTCEILHMMDFVLLDLR